jgi:hypothetical protein
VVLVTQVARWAVVRATERRGPGTPASP